MVSPLNFYGITTKVGVIRIELLFHDTIDVPITCAEGDTRGRGAGEA